MDKDYKKMSHNHGCVTTKSGGTTIKECYGKDSSDVSGSKSDEQAGSMGGGKTDISHSIVGSNANQGNA